MLPMRIWELNFESRQIFNPFPFPTCIVEEIQKKPKYIISGAKRYMMGGCQFVYTLKGRGVFIGKGVEYSLVPGTGFLHKHDDSETIYRYPADGREPWIFLWIAFDGKIADDMVLEMNKRYGYIYKLPQDSGIIRRLSSYRNPQMASSTQWLSLSEGTRLVMDVLASLGESIEKHQGDTRSESISSRAMELIVANLENGVSVEGTAEKLEVSREHLSRKFKEEAGFSIQEYIIAKKMKLAVNFLRDSRMTCKEIALRVGYDSAASFSRVFKMSFGLSPVEARRNGYFPL